MDIFRDTDPISLAGSHWYRLETNAKGEPFRWAGDDVAIAVTQPPRTSLIVRIDIEPGPAVGLKQFVLAIVDEEKVNRGSMPVVARKKIEFLLGHGKPGLHRLALRAEGRGTPVPAPDDKRSLNFRVFGIQVVAVPQDVAFESGGEELRATLARAEEEARALRNDRSELDEKIRTVSDRAAAVESQLREASVRGTELEENVQRLKRELEVRDGVIERLEAATGRARIEADDFRRSAEEKERAIQELRALADERLEVIRTLHGERQQA